MPLAYIDVLIFAIVAAFLFFKLRNTIGTRHGEERKRPSIFDAPQEEKETSKSTQPSFENDQDDDVTLVLNKENASLSSVLTHIALKDSSFDEKDFLSGAKIAFQVIVESFAKGDTETLESLLSPELMDSFEMAIKKRAEKGHVAFTEIIKVKSAEITDCALNGNLAKITVKFVAEETKYIKDEDGNLLSGDPDQIHEVKDIWTFEKDLRSENPNWLLIKTQSE